MALAALHRDERGRVLRKTILQYIRKFKDTITLPNTRSQEEQRMLIGEYKRLPKHFQSDGTPIPFADLESWSDSVNTSFPQVYEGRDDLIPDDSFEDGIIKSFSKIRERRYVSTPEGNPQPFVPMKGGVKASIGITLPDDYRSHMTELLSVKDVAASENSKGDVVPNPLVEKMKNTPKKYARMAREMRTFLSMEFHRNLWYKVLQEWHMKRKPILIGVADSGLTRPIEPKPNDEPLRPMYDPNLLRKYKVASAIHKTLIERYRTQVQKLMEGHGKFSYLPLAFEFVALTKPVQSAFDYKKQLQGESVVLCGKLSMAQQDLKDAELNTKHRTSSGPRNIFSYASELDLSNNELVKPTFGPEFTALTNLNLSNNNMNTIDFPIWLWTQLMSLNFAGNQVPVIPQVEVGNVLEYLNLSSNLLVSVNSITQFTRLEEFHISGNNVGTCTSLMPLTRLRKLTAANCGLKGHWESVFPPLPCLTMLLVDSNPGLDFSAPLLTRSAYSKDAASNNRKFNEHYPQLHTLRAAGKELKLGKEETNASGEITARGKPIILSDLRSLAP